MICSSQTCKKAGAMKRVAELYLYENRSRGDIAEELGISRPTVNRYLKEMREAWQKSALMDFDEAKKRELAKIDRLEEEYWLSWKKSLRENEPADSEPETGDNIDRTGKHGPDGNPRFLQGIQWCINKRCIILGINAPNGVRKKENVTFADLVKGVHADNGKR